MKENKQSDVASILMLCNEEVLGKIGDVCLVRNDKKFSIFSIITGECLVNDFDCYKIHNKKYIELRKIDKYNRSKTMYVVYSIAQNKLWDTPREPEVQSENGLTLFIDHSGEYNTDVSVFLDSTGELLWRLKMNRPNMYNRRTMRRKQLAKYKELLLRMDYTGRCEGYFSIKAKVAFNWFGLRSSKNIQFK